MARGFLRADRGAQRRSTPRCARSWPRGRLQVATSNDKRWRSDTRSLRRQSCPLASVMPYSQRGRDWTKWARLMRRRTSPSDPSPARRGGAWTGRYAEGEPPPDLLDTSGAPQDLTPPAPSPARRGGAWIAPPNRPRPTGEGGPGLDGRDAAPVSTPPAGDGWSGAGVRSITRLPGTCPGPARCRRRSGDG